MTNRIFTILIFISGITISSCKKEIETDFSELYAEKSAELVNQILKEELTCECIIEPSKKTFLEIIEHEMPKIDIAIVRRNLMEQLNLDKQSTLDRMIDISKEFDLEKLLINKSINFVDRSEFDLINSIEGLEKWNGFLTEKCPNRPCYISQPIFSEDFKIVSFDIGYLSYTHFVNNKRKILKYRNGKWNGSNL